MEEPPERQARRRLGQRSLRIRLAIGALALAATGAMVLVAVLGSGAPAGRFGSGPDPAATPRGARMLNPYCGNLPAPGYDRPPNRPVTGPFVDAPYGFAVNVPSGLTGYSSPPDPPHGFGVVLSWQPRAYLRVDAAYDVFYDITADAVHRRDAQSVRLHDALLADRSEAVMLDGASGGRYHMQVRCPRDPQVYVHDDIIVMRNREVYRLQLQTVPARYAEDARRLEELARSWRWMMGPAQ